MQRKLDTEEVQGELVYIRILGIKIEPDGKLDLDHLIKQFADNHSRNTQLTIKRCVQYKRKLQSKK